MDTDAEVKRYIARAEKLLGELGWYQPDTATVAQIATLLKMVDICPNRDRKGDD